MLNLNKPLRTWTPNIILEENDRLIRVMTYNILCDSLICASTNYKEEDCETNPILRWSDRKGKIIKEILEHKADIICIQEFERDEEYIKIMSQNTYECIFKPRCGAHSEGNAIFFNYNKFSLENIYSLELNMNKDGKDISMIYDRDNVVLFGIFKSISYPDTCFIVSNAHLLYNIKRGDVKLGQSYQLADSLSKLKSYYSRYSSINLVFLIKLILSCVGI
jgi:mRNA deadenylase 3'-5' endonuclease subunit Ccr4